MRALLSYFLLCSLLFVKCTAPDNNRPSVAPPSFWSDSLEQVIFESTYFQKDLPATWSSHPEVRYRRAIARNLALFGQPEHKHLLQHLQSDQDAQVRTWAAKATYKTLEAEAIAAWMVSEKEGNVWKYLAASLGRIGDTAHLDFILSGEHPENNRNAWLSGQARALYQFGKRGITRKEGSRLAVALLGENDQVEARKYAANYLARARNLDLTPYNSTIETAFHQQEPATQLALVGALSKTGDARFLKELCRHENPLIRVNAFRGLARFDYSEGVAEAFQALTDSDHQVRRAALRFFQSKGKAADVSQYLKMAQNSEDWAIAAGLRGLVLSFKSDREAEELYQNLQKQINTTQNVFEKAALVKAISNYPSAIAQLKTWTLNDSLPSLVRQAALEGLIAYWQSEPIGRDSMNTALELIQKVLDQKDVGLTYLAANFLATIDVDFEPLSLGTAYLDRAIAACDLPKEVEAIQALLKARANLGGDPVVDWTVHLPPPKGPNWSILSSLNRIPIVEIETSKGTILVELYPQATPATVSNFVTLIQDGTFSNRNFHRMVPGFVIQGGCPRGDGWGAPDYSIRTEAILPFEAGSLGMASAGPDTEGVQWFITHCATPHLDGNYTCFGKVVQGMEVVQTLEQGDRIEKISLK